MSLKIGVLCVKIIILKSLMVSTVAVGAAYAMIWFLVPMFGEQINTSAWVLGFIGPYLIGMPVCLFLFHQADRLRVAHEQLMAAHKDLRRKSRVDPMTGLLNRETFLSILERRHRRSDHGVLVIADADYFKNINDNFGHLNGDTALRLMADAIQDSVRGEDIVGRIGGEEFAIFLSSANSEQAAEVSERVRRAVECIAFQTTCGASVRLTLSAGAALSATAATLSDLMRNADRCLYEAKRTGRNRVIFHQGLRAAA